MFVVNYEHDAQDAQGEQGMNEQMMSADEIADVLKVSPSTVRRLADSGEIPSSKVGVQYRFDLDEVKKAIKQKEDSEV